jgi:TctA family transporter
MTSMIAYKNDWTVLFTRPISGVVMVMTILALAFPLVRQFREAVRARREPDAPIGPLNHEARP